MAIEKAIGRRMRQIGWIGPKAARVPSRVLTLVLCAILIVMGLALVQRSGSERLVRAQAEATTQILNLLRAAMQSGLDAETGQRGFLLTGDPVYLAPYENGASQWLPLVDRLDELMQDAATAEQSADLDRLRVLAQAKLAELAETIRLAQAGQFDAALALVNTNEGRLLMDEYRSIVARLEAQEEQILFSALQNAAMFEARVIPIYAVLGATILGLIVLGFWLERRTAFAESKVRDAEALRAARERSDLLARELNHRVKNLFAVIMAIVTMSGRNQTSVPDVVDGIRERIHALALAHSVSQGRLNARVVQLRDVLSATVLPYAHDEAQLIFRGDLVEVPVKAVTPLGLVINELATNASKYGALSTRDGVVRVEWNSIETEDGAEIDMIWQEQGGPNVSTDREDGFGSVMMTHAAVQLGGDITHDWARDGVRATLRFPAGAA